ncbi:general stress protein [Candidatus Contubernalis alkaliaceticus]|uniref:general stress protein n=1 Tax=Candidatus Contubernalis alkaliaceticus TaxID=338645 RepID=UPI001F4C3EC5|nr:general stress protein [Candidatus Contubernalis alkalaceticus]UNC91850.1 general stress protein [Candidatus Contubernalis alkalaceticus]
MDTTVIGVMKDHSRAEEAVRSLREKGFNENEISIVAKDEGQKNEGQGDLSYSEQNLADGSVTGGALGGVAGLLMGAGALLIPGVGPIIAAGPLAGALTGVVTGGIAGGLIDFGIPEERGRHFEERVKQGDILVAIKTNENKVDTAASILREYGAKDVESHSK